MLTQNYPGAVGFLLQQALRQKTWLAAEKWFVEWSMKPSLQAHPEQSRGSGVFAGIGALKIAMPEGEEINF